MSRAGRGRSIRAHAERRPGRLENAALFALLAGSLLWPIYGWLIGVALVWLSRVWSVRDKLIATLVPPGGLLPAFFLAFGSGYTESCTGGSTADGRSWEHCTGGPSTLVRVLAIIALAFCVIAPFVTAAYLHHRAKRRPPNVRGDAGRERLAPA